MGEPYPPAQYRQQRKGIECNPAVHREAEAVDENAVDESSEFNGAGDNDVQHGSPRLRRLFLGYGPKAADRALAHCNVFEKESRNINWENAPNLQHYVI